MNVIESGSREGGWKSEIAKSGIVSELLSSTLRLGQSSVFRISPRRVIKIYNKLETFRIIDIIIYNYIQSKIKDRLGKFRLKLKEPIVINGQRFSEAEIDILELEYKQVGLATSIYETRKGISKGDTVIVGNAKYIGGETLFDLFKGGKISRNQIDGIIQDILTTIRDQYNLDGSGLQFDNQYNRLCI